MEQKKCKECLIEKTLDQFYVHPLWVMWVLPRCKECIKSWRKSDRELKMSRIRDRDRYVNNAKRREYIFKSSIERRIRKWYAKVHWDTDNRIKRKYGRPNKCSVCYGEIDWVNILRIVFHHPDYTKPYIWIFCCDVCHSKIHLWKVEPKEYIDLLK